MDGVYLGGNGIMHGHAYFFCVRLTLRSLMVTSWLLRGTLPNVGVRLLGSFFNDIFFLDEIIAFSFYD